MARNWFNIRALAVRRAEVLIYDEISAHSGQSAKDFSDILAAFDGNIAALTLRINSPGGDTAQASAIVTMLERLKVGGTRITVYIDGLAASAASWIAMTGHEVIMPSNSLMMIHLPTSLVIGDAEEMRDIAGILDKVRDTMVSAYAAKSKKSRADIVAIMEAETWYTAEEAVAAGFADRVERPVAIAANFDLANRFKHLPPSPQTINELSEQFWAKRGIPIGIPEAPKTLAEIGDKVWIRRDNIVGVNFKPGE